MPAPRGWRAAGERVPGAPRDPLSLLTAPRDLKARGVHWASRFGDGGPCRGPAPLSYGAGVSRRGGTGLSLPRGTWGYPAPGTRRSEAPDRAQGAALTRSSALYLRTSSPAAEYGLRGATSQRGQPLPIRPVRSVPSWTSGALGNGGGPRGRPFQAPPCKQTRLRFPLPAPAACKAR